MMENELCRKTIGDLAKNVYKFVVPSYQRGYRWTQKQVSQLLNDLNEYFDMENDGEQDKQGTYCLQPVILKNNDADIEKLDVIDGQQRLTTILLIYSVIMGYRPRANLPYEIEYDSKTSSELSKKADLSETEIISELLNIDYPDLTLFLRLMLSYNKNGMIDDISRELYEKNVDYYHMYMASKCIDEWIKGFEDSCTADNMVSQLKSKLDGRTQLIWYKVNENISAEKVFTSVNDGKIVLTNSELIKVLILKSENFFDIMDRYVNVMQYRLSSEWDSIEQELHNDELFYFLTGKENYCETRIDLIFDLLADEINESWPENERINKLDNKTYSYDVFNKDFEGKKKIDSHYVMEVWDRVSECFMLFKEWFSNDKLYHRIGYLIVTAKDKRNQLKSIVDHRNVSKSDFIKYLDGKIKDRFKNDDFDDINYENTSAEKLGNLLLLFNIATLLKNKKCDTRFSFDKFIRNQWDIEHIRAVNDDPSRDKKSHRTLIENMLIPLKFINTKESSDLQTKLNEWLEKNLDVDDAKFDVPYNELQEIYKQIRKMMGEDDKMDDIGNLTLLDSKTNRGYKNWTFAAKREFLLQKEEQGQFIPLCTKNIFMKAYSKSVTDLMMWNNDDANWYQDQFLRVMEPYVTKKGE